MGRQSRVWLRVHHGEHMECQYSLLSFGVPRECFPVSYDGKLKTKEHNKWVAQQLVRENFERTSDSFPGVDFPGDKDVLLGHGKAIYNHRGNVCMRSLVAEYTTSYNTAKYGVKLQVAGLLLEAMKQRGGRFLKLQADGWWVQDED